MDGTRKYPVWYNTVPKWHACYILSDKWILAIKNGIPMIYLKDSKKFNKKEGPSKNILISLRRGFLVRVSIPAQKSWPRSKLGRKVFIQLTSSKLLLNTKGCQDWNSSRSESGSRCRGHGGMFFTGLPPLACSACSLIEPKTTSPEMVPPTRGPSPLITNWENAPQLDLMKAFPQLKLLSLW